MTIYTRPTTLPAWAESGEKVQPSSAEIQTGWPAASNTPPSRQRFNWIQNWLANGLRYFMQIGIPEWSADESYPIYARVQYNGEVYRAVAASSNVTPGTDTSKWLVGASNAATVITAATDKATPVDADTFGFVNSSGGLLAKFTWANLKAALFSSPAFTGTPTAPNPSTGVRSTQIATMQKFADEFGSSLSANGYQKLPSGLIIQWGSASTTATIGPTVGTTNFYWNNAPITFPIAFPNACLSAQCTADDGTGMRVSTMQSASKTGCVLTLFVSQSGAAISGKYIAIGY